MIDNIIYKEPTSYNFGQYCFLLTAASTLYMFRTLSAPIIRSTKNCSNSHWCVSWVGWCMSSKDVQGRLSTTLCHSRIRATRLVLIRLWHNVVDNRPWTSLLGIHRPDSWQAPVAVTTVFSTPDDGRRKRPEHLECTCSC